MYNTQETEFIEEMGSLHGENDKRIKTNYKSRSPLEITTVRMIKLISEVEEIVKTEI